MVIIGKSDSSVISNINLGTKPIEKRSVGNPYAVFDETGARNGHTASALDLSMVRNFFKKSCSFKPSSATNNMNREL